MINVAYINLNKFGTNYMNFGANNNGKKGIDELRLLDGEYNLSNRPSLRETFSYPEGPNIDVQDISKKYQERLFNFPFVINTLLKGIGFYLDGKTEVGKFMEIYLGDITDLYARASLGIDADAFSKKYSSEISLLKKVASAGYDYAKGERKNDRGCKKAFDTIFLTSIQEYLESPNKPAKRFLD